MSRLRPPIPLYFFISSDNPLSLHGYSPILYRVFCLTGAARQTKQLHHNANTNGAVTNARGRLTWRIFGVSLSALLSVEREAPSMHTIISKHVQVDGRDLSQVPALYEQASTCREADAALRRKWPQQRALCLAGMGRQHGL